jgi:preprotein translocase subunit YajC
MESNQMRHDALYSLVIGQTEGAPGGFPAIIAQMMPLVLVFVIMYLLLIRPQQKKAKEHREMVNRLKAGDRVVTNGGMHGTVTGVSEQTVRVQVAEKVEVTLVRSAIATVLGADDAGGPDE